MRKATLGILCALACLGWRASAPAQEAFALMPVLESNAVPDLDTNLLITGAVGTQVEVIGNMTLTSSGITGNEGPQGWSWGVRNEGIEILSTTVAGTVSADVNNGGLVNGGFVINELIDPARNGGKEGSVQAVVLSFALPITLPPNQTHVTCKNTYKATVGAVETSASIRFEDGLVGSGQPVHCYVTFMHDTSVPTRGQKSITIRPEEANCSDSLDNDMDGDTDCLDSDCADDPACTTDVGDCELLLKKVKIKAGKKPGTDSFFISGWLIAPESSDFVNGDTITLQLGDLPPWTIDEPLKQRGSKPKFSYKGTPTLTLDLTKGTFKVSAKKVDLKGLTAPVRVKLDFGSYHCWCDS